MMTQPEQPRFPGTAPAEPEGMHPGGSGSLICIGCGCDDEHACFDETLNQPCHWIRLDPVAGKGLCSCCPELAVAWDRGDREVRVPVAILGVEFVPEVPEARCLGCGSNDRDWWVDEASKGELPPHWLCVDYDLGTGVCSHCEAWVEAWDSGVRARLGMAESA
jgi:hypothetical protein